MLVKVTLFHNESMIPSGSTPADRDDIQWLKRLIEGPAYEVGDRLKLQWQGELEMPTTVDLNANLTDVCEQLFRMHNMDDRPRNQEIRSMSKGDICHIDMGESEAAFACDTLGWTIVPLALA